MRAAQRHPPAFSLELRAQPRLQALIALLALLSAAAAVAGLAAHDARAWWLLLALPVVGLLAWRAARVRPRRLQWDGQAWRLAPIESLEVGAAVQVEVVLDFGAWLLLRTQGRLLAPAVYLPLSRAALGAAWGPLRATLYSARPHDESARLHEP